MSWGSSSPGAISALLALLNGNAELAGVNISDGPVMKDGSNPEVLSVGYQGNDDEDAVEGDIEPQGTSPTGLETYDIHCAVAVLNGDNDLDAARQRAMTLFGAVGRQLLADKTLRHTVMRARITSWAMRTNQTDAGARARVRFDVHVEASTAI